MAWIASSNFILDAAIQFKLCSMTPSRSLTNFNSVAQVFGHQVWIGEQFTWWNRSQFQIRWPHLIKTWIWPSKPYFMAVWIFSDSLLLLCVVIFTCLCIYPKPKLSSKSHIYLTFGTSRFENLFYFRRRSIKKKALIKNLMSASSTSYPYEQMIHDWSEKGKICIVQQPSELILWRIGAEEKITCHGKYIGQMSQIFHGIIIVFILLNSITEMIFLVLVTSDGGSAFQIRFNPVVNSKIELKLIMEVFPLDLQSASDSKVQIQKTLVKKYNLKL